MAKRLSERDKEEIVKCFTLGKTIDELASMFKFTKLTITRNLKKTIGEKKYKELINKNIRTDIDIQFKKENISSNESTNSIPKNSYEKLKDDFYPITPFLEITPLDCEIENSPQKDLSSVHISEITLPKIVYMVVDKKIELEVKYLKDYPDWQFLSQEELNRRTIEIFLEMKNAKRLCNKEQKVIKVPNSEVFKIVAPLLLSRGISRIISDDKLIAL